MSDLEQDIRELLDEEVRSAPPPHEGTGAVRRTRRRQGAVIAGGALAAVALVAGSLASLRAIDRADRATFVDQPTVTTTVNGITMSHPGGWYVVDPGDAGLNGPNPTPDLPKLILAVAPFDPGELFACPGMVEGTPHAFLMTVQEEPLALSGASAAPWPVELEPLGVDAAESGCYPGWEFLRAGWTAADRTFEARVGFAPDVSDANRDALLAAFASMSYEPVVDGATSVVLAAGTAGGEDWELIAGQAFLATSGESSLVLSLEAESTSSGMGFDPSSDELQMTDLVLGAGAGAQRMVFGAVSANAVRLGLQVSGGDPVALPAPEILDAPDTIDPDLNAFVFTIRLDQTAVVTAFDDSNAPMAYAQIGPEGMGPIATPTPDEVIFDGRTNDCRWTLSRAAVAPGQDRFDLTAEDVSVGFVANVGADAPPIQLSSYTCSKPPGGTLVFGLLTDEVADTRWPSSAPDEHGVPDCWPADLPDRFCVFLLDGVGDAGEVIAFDANGNEIGRARFP